MNKLKKVEGTRSPERRVPKDTSPVYQSEINVVIDKVNELVDETIKITLPTYTTDISSEGSPVYLSNIPSGYLPTRVFIQSGGSITDFSIEDSEQTVCFDLSTVGNGISILYPKTNRIPVFAPYLTLTATGVESSYLSVVIECSKTPF